MKHRVTANLLFCLCVRRASLSLTPGEWVW